MISQKKDSSRAYALTEQLKEKKREKPCREQSRSIFFYFSILIAHAHIFRITISTTSKQIGINNSERQMAVINGKEAAAQKQPFVQRVQCTVYTKYNAY